MRLLINEPGLFMGTRRGRILIRPRGGKELMIPFTEVDSVALMTRGAAISSALLRELARRRIPLIVYSSTGYPAAWMAYVKSGAIGTRKGQLSAQGTSIAGRLAKGFVWGKIQNQRNLLAQAARNRKTTQPGMYRLLSTLSSDMGEILKGLAEIPESPPNAAKRNAMKLEAEAARIYWEGFKLLVPDHVGFDSRRKRYEEPRDLANVLLNYSYGLLAAEALLAVIYAGLDPYAGFLHEDYPRRPALVMDLMEEFRQPVVDRAVLRLVSRTGEKDVEGAIDRDGRLTREWRHSAYRAFAERMRENVKFEGRRYSIHEHMARQARKVASAVTSNAMYTPFVER